MKKREVSQRIAVAFAMMAVLLFSVGTFIAAAQSTAHSCCHMSMPGSLSSNHCCTAAPQIPPVVVSAAPAPMAMDIEQAYVAPTILRLARSTAIATIIPAQSPPGGAFSLRI